MSQLATRPNVEQIVATHDRTLVLYRNAYKILEEARAALQEAHSSAKSISPNLDNNAITFSHSEEVKRFYNVINLPDLEEYLATAERLMNLKTWGFIIERTELETLMDVEAKKKLRTQMDYIPPKQPRRMFSGPYDSDGRGILNPNKAAETPGMPPVTVENINATLDQFMADAGTIWLRGIANAFSNLDRRFKSHDGFKIGARIILTNAFSSSGGWNWGNGRHATARDTLMDIERVFTIMDGKKPVKVTYAGAIGSIDEIRLGYDRPAQCEVETNYFKIRVFKNGNAHLWMKRKDLVRDVNLALANFYGEILPDGAQTEEDPLENKKTTPAKRFGFFPTPSKTVDEVFRYVSCLRAADRPRMRILEPSAGTGNLARRCIRESKEIDQRHKDKYRLDHAVDCIEIQPELAEDLRQEGIYNRVLNQDFLKVNPETTGLYDLIVMNPPFDMSRDIDHVHHALQFLAPEGTLISIMSAGVEYREDKKNTAFRSLVIEKLKGKFFDLPAGSFSEVGTNVNTIVLKVHKNGNTVWQ